MPARPPVPLCAASVACLTLAACAPAMTASAPVPAALVPPTGNSEFLRATGRGVQIYTCQSMAGAAPAWTLKAPEAVLTDAAGTVVASHGAGPSWTAPDGSGVLGARVASVDSPSVNNSSAGAIAWLLLSAKASGTGILGKTTYVQRLNTVGGVAPAIGCDAAALSSETRVDYSATYVFFNGQ